MSLLRAAAAVALISSVVPATGRAQYSGWHNNLDRAAELSAKSGKPIFAVFRCER